MWPTRATAARLRGRSWPTRLCRTIAPRWQAFGGLGYQFSWGSVLGGWRYIDYEFKSGSNIESLTFNGPMIGVAFNW